MFADAFRRVGRYNARVLAFTFVLAALGSGCSRGGTSSQIPTTEQIDEARNNYSLGRSSLARIRIYFDASTSMRGFALAATANQAGVGEEFQSVLTALDSLSSVFEESATPIQAQERANASIARFGGVVEELPSTSIVPAALGRLDVSPMAGQSADSRSASKDCAGSAWSGSPAVRQRIDALYSERITCLNLVFDEILQAPDPRQAAIVVTDAEQEAPVGSSTCPSPKNLATIQANLYEWVRRGGYVGVVAFRLRSLEWNSALEPRSYCTCGVRQLYVYLMTPSAEQADDVYSHLARLWRGKPDSISYLPFTPRPASQFDVTMALRRGSGDPPAIVPATAPTHLLNPEQGMLSQFWIKLNDEETEVAFRVHGVAFEDPARRTAPGFLSVDRSKAQFEWQHPTPLRLAAANPAPESADNGRKNGPAIAGDGNTSPPTTPRSVLTRGDAVGLEFTELPPESSAQASTDARLQQKLPDIARTGHFNARQKLLPPEALTDSLPSVRFRLRRLPGGTTGTELFLLQLDSTSVDLPDQIASSPFVQSGLRPCLSLENITSQMRFVYRRSPVVRFLVRVDY